MRRIRRLLQARPNLVNNRGFTLIEILVAVVILSVGLLGMAAMTIVIIRGNRMAVQQTNATNLAQQLMERLRDIDFATLGTDINQSDMSTGVVNQLSYEFGIDEQGNAGGPFNRWLKVCNAVSTNQTADTTDVCDDIAPTTTTIGPDELRCKGNLNAGEIRLRIVVAWRGRGGNNCRKVAMETIVVNTL